MPGLSGQETARMARRARPELKVLFLSGYPAHELGSVQIAEFPSFCHALQDFEAMFEGDGPRRSC
jgi:hypothetical protein